MKIKITLLILFLLGTSVFAQDIWTKIGDQTTIAARKSEGNEPSEYEIFRLDFNKFKSALQVTGIAEKSKSSNLFLDFPTSEGSFKKFSVAEAPMMEPELAAKFPDIKSYIGTAASGETVHFSVTLYGLHALIQTPGQGNFLIDAYPNDTSTYIAYNKSALTGQRTFSCDTEAQSEGQSKQSVTDQSRLSDGNLRTFRLAMACTIEYANFHIGRAGLTSGTTQQKVNAVLAAMAVTVTRVNSIYQKDLSVRLIFVANNDLLVFIDSDSFSNTNASALIGESQTTIDNIIGSSAYDIGHTVSTGGGGLAGLGVVCRDGLKGRGITGLSQPVGDAYDVDYVAHEIGHQFGGNHTFNGDTGSCSGSNRNNSTAVEPGSGTTIMAYAGICPSQNVQANSNDYFHAVSIAEINARIQTTASCAILTPNGNTAPVVSAGPDYTIPKETAFILKANATDVNNDILTYCWEQIDAQIPLSPVPQPTSAQGANFRSLLPSTDPNRYLPSFSDVLNGNLFPTWEVLSSVSRVFNFAVTVRDNRENSGQSARDNSTVNVNADAGPFQVLSQNTSGIVWSGNSTQTITWQVAGTNGNGINTTNVKISLLVFNRLSTQSVVLAESTPNDGSETISVPNDITATNCRIVVEAVGNIFYAVNGAAFGISPSLSNENFGLDSFALFPNPNRGEFTISFNSTSASNNIKVNTYDVSGRLIGYKTFQNNGLFNEKIQLNTLNAGMYIVVVEDGEKKETRKILVQ